MDFEEIFDINSFKVFDKITSIKHSIKEKDYNEYKFFSAAYVSEPGQHWWDIFLTDKSLILPERPHYDINTLYGQKVLPKIESFLKTKSDERKSNGQVYIERHSQQLDWAKQWDLELGFNVSESKIN